ncbi:MAG: hypothetical protein IPK74_16695 [Deltaproteobacteria bacterium]|nr:hypothetical protein [Deltaproteobacteria bacterium]
MPSPAPVDAVSAVSAAVPFEPPSVASVPVNDPALVLADAPPVVPPSLAPPLVDIVSTAALVLTSVPSIPRQPPVARPTSATKLARSMQSILTA